MSLWVLCPRCRRVDGLAGEQPAECSRCGAALEVLSEQRFTDRYAAGDFYEVRTPDAAAATLPPTPAELDAAPLLLNSLNRPVLERTGRGAVRMPWVWWVVAAFGAAFLTLFTLDLSPAERPAVILVCDVPALLLIVWLGFITRDRYQLLRQGIVVRGALQCLSARVTGEGDEHRWLTLGYAFHAPDGRLITGSTNALVGRMSSKNSEANGALPQPGARRAIAVLYSRPDLHKVL